MIDMDIRGADDIDRLLNQIAPRQATNIMRATIHGIAGTIRDDAKRFMPVDEGDMRRGTKTKRERAVRGQLLSTVRVAHSAFYWRFLEYGDGPDGVEHAMFARAVENYRADQNRVLVTQFVRKFEAALARAQRRQANGG